MQSTLNVAGEQINDASVKSIRTRSTFPSLSYHLYNTYRFGEYSSNFVMDAVEGDRIPLRSAHNVGSYSLKAPLMQNIMFKKDYYQIPMESILPKNWDKFYTNPVIGDDVPDDCGTGVADFWSLVSSTASSLVSTAYNIISSSSYSEAQKATAFFRCLVFLEYFYSNGSLITTLGCHGAKYCKIEGKSAGFILSHNTFDEWFDFCLSSIVNNVKYFSVDIDGSIKYVLIDSTDSAVVAMSVQYPCITLRDLLSYFRDDLNVFINSVSTTGSSPFESFTKGLFSSSNFDFVFDAPSGVPYNLSRVAAYQLVCSHFYSNDHVDYVYSAELFRQLIWYYITNSININLSRFTVNGLSYDYDALSAHFFSLMISFSDPNVFLIGTSTYSTVRGYFSTLFSYRRSLRFMDYFTGSRTRPLAVGDVNVDVQTGTPNYVSVIDTTQKIQKQRFLNAVNRFGRKFDEYIKGLSGITPSQDYHNPLYLAHTSDGIFAREVENTGAAQLSDANSVTSRLMSNGARYEFEINVDRPSVILGICYFDIPRVYLYSTERPLFHMNRFDMFNPFMQFIGDQPVYRDELGSKRTIAPGTFGYQLRHMEYKQRYDQGAGGFVNYLPGFIFGNDSDSARDALTNFEQNPDYIRSLPSELDKFYVSLTGFSLASYFHFFVDNNNACDASRPMAYAPSIL